MINWDIHRDTKVQQDFLGGLFKLHVELIDSLTNAKRDSPQVGHHECLRYGFNHYILRICFPCTKLCV